MHFYRPDPKGAGLDGEGYPIPGPDWGVPHPRSGRGGVQYPIPGLDRGVPHPADGGYPPSKIRMGVLPIQDWMGYPLPHQQDGVCPLSKTGWGTPPPVRRQISKVSTCYAAGGVPLAFTQEDFLATVISSYFSNMKI